MVEKGDIVAITSDKTGERKRTGLVLSQLGSMLKIRWDDDSETMFIPGPGTLHIVAHERNQELVSSQS